MLRRKAPRCHDTHPSRTPDEVLGAASSQGRGHYVSPQTALLIALLCITAHIVRAVMWAVVMHRRTIPTPPTPGTLCCCCVFVVMCCRVGLRQCTSLAHQNKWVHTADAQLTHAQHEHTHTHTHNKKQRVPPRRGPVAAPSRGPGWSADGPVMWFPAAALSPSTCYLNRVSKHSCSKKT